MKTNWSSAELKILAANNLLSASKVAEKLPGKSRSAVVAKRNRLKGVMFPCDKNRRALRQHNMAMRAADRKRRDQSWIEAIRERLVQGEDRNAIVEWAVANGATHRLVGKVLGVSKSQINWIVNGPYPKSGARAHETRSPSAAHQ